VPISPDPTADVDEFSIIKRSNDLELAMIDSWLSQLGVTATDVNFRRNLLELRNLCLLRNRLLRQIENQHLATLSA